MYWARMRPGGDAADEEDGHVAVGGKQDVVGFGEQRGADRNGLLPAPHVHAADDLALAVQLALDAVFDLAHQRHVVETLMRQFGLGRAGRRGRAVRFRTRSFDRAHGDYL